MNTKEYVICWRGSATGHKSYYDIAFATRADAERFMKHLDRGCGLVERWVECVEIDKDGCLIVDDSKTIM